MRVKTVRSLTLNEKRSGHQTHLATGALVDLAPNLASNVHVLLHQRHALRTGDSNQVGVGEEMDKVALII